MGYRFLADAVLLLHLGFILFVVFGALLVARWPRLLPLHLAAAAWGFGIEVLGAVCPLTYLENRLRALAGVAGYADGFIEHYLLPLVYPGAMSRGLQLALAAGVLAVNAALYAWLWRRRTRVPYSTQAKPSRAISANDSAGPQEPAG
ncbi:DUF2784 domain-containing protein [Massilia oculi]|uniref:DUF2784 domain-containing protein n=1 Tax=Massilia hydrophila TaxID=3044279 RepID=A0ABS7Y9L5_9BURK|nr:DUF2784 domain-containing protein [Massilia oculi]MCA1855621.1 DUF2784 domain-containing protein [Massilia oculi]